MVGYVVQFAEWTLCFILLGFSLNILAGYTKINSLALAGVFGLGAYSFALALAAFGSFGVTGWIIAAVIAIVLCAVINFLIAVPTLRISTDHFLVASLALQYLLYELFKNSEWTGRSTGISGITLGIDRTFTHLILFGFGALCIVASIVFLNGRFGRLFYAIKDDELLSRSAGISILKGKLLSAMASGAIAGAAGCLFALNQTYIDPESFTLHTTILIYAIMLIGGPGTPWGPLVGGILVMGLPEALSYIALSPELVGPLRRLLFGLALLLLLFVRPQGLVPRVPTVRLGSWQRTQKR